MSLGATQDTPLDSQLARPASCRHLLRPARRKLASHSQHTAREYLFQVSKQLVSAVVVATVLLLLTVAPQLSHCLVINVGLPGPQRSHSLSHSHNTEPIAHNMTALPRLLARQNNNANHAKLLEVDALGYLQRYGYMNETLGNANLISEDSFNEAVISFQRFAGIPETGTVDSLTVKYMQMPRCGNKDKSSRAEQGRRRRRRKRYALQGSKWRRQELTYRISQYPTRFMHKKEQVDGQIEKAFKIWSQVAPIDFVVKREGRVHIDIRFSSGEHGDGDPFDGPGNTLAHAYFPQYGGDAHFDDQEYWTVDSYAGTNIFQVAAHELGHSLGLGHSSVREALMAPFYQKYKPNFKLHADDILGIQALYGDKSDSDTDHPSSTSTTTTTTTTTEQPPDTNNRRPIGFSPANSDSEATGGRAPDLCRSTSFDAITRTEDGNTYVFRGQYYWLLLEDGVAPGYPARISRDWDGLPGNLDAALTWSDGKTFFFKGDKYWRFFNKRRDPGYPKLISAGFAGIPNNVDAAFVWSGNGKTYFFKRDKYWRFDSKQEPPVSSQYPKSIRNWVGLPTSGIDAAFKWQNGATYFFKDDVYYRFDDRNFEVENSKPSYPRQITEWWLGCPDSNLPVRRRSGDQRLDSGEGEEPSVSPSNQHPHFHRRPLIFDSSSSSMAAAAAAAERKPAGGNSITRSIFESLATLFPSAASLSNSYKSSPNSDSSASSSLHPAEDWAFHGADEQRRLKRKPASPDTSRWSFPLGGSTGEQSSSELRMAPSTPISESEAARR